MRFSRRSVNRTVLTLAIRVRSELVAPLGRSRTENGAPIRTAATATRGFFEHLDSHPSSASPRPPFHPEPAARPSRSDSARSRRPNRAVPPSKPRYAIGVTNRGRRQPPNSRHARATGRDSVSVRRTGWDCRPITVPPTGTTSQSYRHHCTESHRLQSAIGCGVTRRVDSSELVGARQRSSGCGFVGCADARCRLAWCRARNGENGCLGRLHRFAALSARIDLLTERAIRCRRRVGRTVARLCPLPRGRAGGSVRERCRRGGRRGRVPF